MRSYIYTLLFLLTSAFALQAQATLTAALNTPTGGFTSGDGTAGSPYAIDLGVLSRANAGTILEYTFTGAALTPNSRIQITSTSQDGAAFLEIKGNSLAIGSNVSVWR